MLELTVAGRHKNKCHICSNMYTSLNTAGIMEEMFHSLSTIHGRDPQGA